MHHTMVVNRIGLRTLARRGNSWVLGCAVALALSAVTHPAHAQGANVVISQVYGGGGNSGAPYNQDFVELFNRSAAPVDISGWSIQYTAPNGTAWSTHITAIPASTTLAAGQYYLIGMASGTNGDPLPTLDHAGTTNLGANGGKVALVNAATALGAKNCPASASIVDLVGYGNADCSETAAAPAPSNTLAVRRGSNGCQDTNNNSADFEAVTPTPRNTATTPAPCAFPCRPDINHSGTVNVDDLLAVITSWGDCSSPCPPACPADIAPIGGDCHVNVDDLLLVITGWGPCA